MNDGSASQEATAAVVQTGLVAARLPALRSKSREMFDAGILQLTVDLAGTQMVDSAGIGLLISAHHSVKSREHLANIKTDLLSIEQAEAAIDEQVVHRAVKQGAEKKHSLTRAARDDAAILPSRDCRGAVPPSLFPSTRVRFGWT